MEAQTIDKNIFIVALNDANTERSKNTGEIELTYFA